MYTLNQLAGFYWSRALRFVWSKRYKLTRSIDCGTHGIFTISFADDGAMIACGGSNGMRIYYVGSCIEVPTPAQNTFFSNFPTASLWLQTRDMEGATIVYGTGNGTLHIWCNEGGSTFEEVYAQRLLGGTEITCLATQRGGGNVHRLGIGLFGNRIIVADWNTNTKVMTEIFLKDVGNITPRTIAFTVTERNIYVVSLHGGQCVLLEGAMGREVSRRVLAPVVSQAAISTSLGEVVIDNSADGFTLYRLDTAARQHGFITQKCVHHRPKQVAFAEDSVAVVGGTDQGVAYVFNRSTGEVLDVLEHAIDGMVHSIATCYVEGVSYIACASTSENPGSQVSIWTYKVARYSQDRMRPRSARGNGSGLLFNHTVVVNILIVVLAALFVVEKIGQLLNQDWSTRIHVTQLGSYLDPTTSTGASTVASSLSTVASSLSTVASSFSAVASTSLASSSLPPVPASTILTSQDTTSGNWTFSDTVDVVGSASSLIFGGIYASVISFTDVAFELAWKQAIVIAEEVSIMVQLFEATFELARDFNV